MRCFILQSIKDVSGVGKNPDGICAENFYISNTIESFFQDSRVLQTNFKQIAARLWAQRKNVKRVEVYSFLGVRLCLRRERGKVARNLRIEDAQSEKKYTKSPLSA